MEENLTVETKETTIIPMNLQLFAEGEATELPQTTKTTETTPTEPQNTIDIAKIKEAIKKPATTPDEKIAKLEAELLLAKKQRDEYSSKVAEFNRNAKENANKMENEKDETAKLLADMTAELEEARRQTKLNALSSRFAKVGITDDKVLDSFAKTLSYVPDEQLEDFFTHFTNLNVAIAEKASSDAIVEYVKKMPTPPKGESTNTDTVNDILERYKKSKQGTGQGVSFV